MTKSSSLQEKRKRGFPSLLALRREEIVRAGPAKVDGGDRDAAARRHLGKAKAGIDHQRRADHQHGVGLFERRLRGCDLVARYGFAKEDNIRLLDANAR